MSRSGIIGYMNTSAFDHMPTYDMNAFALGARLVNPRSRVLDFRLKLVNNWDEHITARRKFAELGADVAFCRHSPDNHLDRKAFNEVYAQIYEINKHGYPTESYAAATFNWEPVYDKVISDLLQGKTKLYESGGDDCNPIHFGWGLSTGIMDIFPVDFAIGDNGVKLMRIFRGLIKNTKFNPFEGPVYDNENKLRFESGYTPTLLEIQAMNWYESSVTELNP
jgi:basic membrane protein A